MSKQRGERGRRQTGWTINSEGKAVTNVLFDLLDEEVRKYKSMQGEERRVIQRAVVRGIAQALNAIIPSSSIKVIERESVRRVANGF